MANLARDPIRTADLFAGAGGLTTGLHRASSRFAPQVAVEWDRAAAASFQKNYLNTDVVSCPIEEWVKTRDIPNVDVIIGGPPCQGFSSLGKRDANDERNALWRQYAHVIVKAQPKYFVVENVARFLDSTQFSDFLEQTAPGGVLQDYEIPEHSRGVLNAANYGAPQSRRRTVLIGRHRDVPAVPLPAATVAQDDWVTVRQAFAAIPQSVHEVSLPEMWTEFENTAIRGTFQTFQLHLTRNFDDLSLKRFDAIPRGGNRFDLPDDLKAPCWIKHTSGSADVMGRLHWDRPSVTIRTEFVKPEKGRYLHPVEHRAITLREGAQLQGFPSTYKWCGSKTAIAKQIGNAVPIPLGSAIGRALLTVL